MMSFMLDIIDAFGSGMLAVFQIFLLIKFSFNIKIFKSVKKIFFIILFFSSLYALIFLNFDGVLKTILVSFINIFICLYFYKISLLKSIFINFIYIFLLVIVDLLYLFCLTNVLGMSKEFCYDVFAGSFFGSFIVFLLYWLIIFFLNKPLKKLLATQIDTNKKIVIFSILILLCILLFFYTIVEKFQVTEDVFLYLFCIAILMLVLLNLIKQVIENKKLSDKYDKLLEFMTTYEEEIENQRILRHEIKNEFLVVKAKLVDSEKNADIVKYIDVILKDKVIVKQEKYAKFAYLPPRGIKGLCYFKVQEAENLGVKVSINIAKSLKHFDINKLTISEQRDLARILGVLLDNAREASYKSLDRKMGLEVYYSKKDGVSFIVSNTFDGVVDTNKIGKEIFSTKGKNRGHGLLLVKYILEKNKIFELNTDINNGVYVQIIKIKTNK